MKDYDAAAVREVIESLIAEIGIDNVPVEIDVDGALAALNEEIYGGAKEEGAVPEMADSEEALVAEADVCTPAVE